MKPHELASQLPEKHTPEHVAPPSFEALGTLLDDSENVWRELAAALFEENEFGYVKLNPMGWSARDRPDYVNGIQVFFIDPLGTQVVLGGIYREPELNLGIAMVSLDNKKIYSKYLTPDDDRWEVIVGTVERAVKKCVAEKKERVLLGEKASPVEYQGAKLDTHIGFSTKKIAPGHVG